MTDTAGTTKGYDCDCKCDVCTAERHNKVTHLCHRDYGLKLPEEQAK